MVIRENFSEGHQLFVVFTQLLVNGCMLPVVSLLNQKSNAGPAERKLSEDKENTTQPISCRKNRPPLKYRHFLIRSIREHKHAQRRLVVTSASANK
jgi:hypothetical protein